MTSSPKFSPGGTVQRLNQPEAIGVVLEARFNRQAEEWQYRVQFGSTARTLLESMLRAFVPVASPWKAVYEGRTSGAEHFAALLTRHRLRKPPTRIAASLATSRTEIHPHQFKPLLKFLDHPEKRLLIADDVGLGKTIEAGYILRELEARQQIDRVVVLCPARLCTKWKKEMEARFQEVFEIVTGRAFVEVAGRVRRGREPEPFRWIVSYESARRQECIEAIEEAQIAIDYLVADEAHRLRNPDTLQHDLGRALTQLADAAVFLSATPVQNGLDDLWHLLRLLSPEAFRDRTLFMDQLAANRPLLAAQAALRQRPADKAAAERCLGDFFELMPGHSKGAGALRMELEGRVQALGLDRAEITALQLDLAALSPTAPFISRTRKAEALPNRAVRVAHWHRVILTPDERAFYDSVEHLCHGLWGKSDRGAGNDWALQMAYRITASCIPAAVQYFAERTGNGGDGLWSEWIEEGGEPGPDGEVALQGGAVASMRNAVATYRCLRTGDSKLAALKDVLAKMWESDRARGESPRKVVLFSFFRRTLEYLRRELEAASIDVRMIHGQYSVAEREVAIEQFLEDPRVRLLLTSEVGGEGIDLQRASAVINYDLPWNPMVVEQRIGRVDRIGQRAATIQVVNLVLGDSIEERILQRLFDKIGLFRESIGELDEILGEEVRQLAEAALSGVLSGEELGRRVEESANALERRVQDARAMLQRMDGLVAADQALVDEIEAVTGERQIPSAWEVRLFLNEYLATVAAGAQLPAATTERVVKVGLGGQVAAALEQNALALGPEAAVLARRLSAGPIAMTLSREAAYHHPSAELVHIRHPLVLMALRDGESRGSEWSSSFALRLEGSSKLEKGTYLFLVSFVELRGHRPSTRICAGICSLGNGRLRIQPEETSSVLVELLERARSTECPAMDETEFERTSARLLEGMDELVANWETREKRLDSLRRERQHASRLAYLELVHRRAQARLDTVRRRSTHPTALRLAEARAHKAAVARDAVLAEAPRSLWEGVERQDVAVGVIVVT